jgi:hypothetical protein
LIYTVPQRGSYVAGPKPGEVDQPDE